MTRRPVEAAPAAPQRYGLFLSRDHAVYIGDVLIPVKHLANGGSIAQVPVVDVSYNEVESRLRRVLPVAGSPAKSYRNTSNRTVFASRTCDAKGCAPSTALAA